MRWLGIMLPAQGLQWVDRVEKVPSAPSERRDRSERISSGQPAPLKMGPLESWWTFTRAQSACLRHSDFFNTIDA